MSSHTAPDNIRRQLQSLYTLKGFKPKAWLSSFDHAYINIHLLERSIALASENLKGKLLDVGCGEQPYRAYFPNVEKYTGCDFDATRGPVDFACPADKIPMPDESFDSLLCTEVLEHVPDPSATLVEFHRILRAEGMVLLTTPMYWPSHEAPYDFFRYPAHGLIALFERNGFEVLQLIPRGGIWAFFGQVVLHCLPQYFGFQLQRKLWNHLLLLIDGKRLNPRITIGWTVLAKKKEVHS